MAGAEVTVLCCDIVWYLSYAAEGGAAGGNEGERRVR